MCNPSREYLERLSKEIECERKENEVLEKELELSKLKLKNRKLRKEIRDNDKDDGSGRNPYLDSNITFTYCDT